MIKALMTAFVIAGLVTIGATVTMFVTPVPANKCFAFIGRDDTDPARVFILNTCDGSVRILVMPPPPPAGGTPNYNKPRI
jgi:hypothetical protein